ncbi:MAG: DUF3152 domain-containing protein [Actinomycetota bacterium]
MRRALFLVLLFTFVAASSAAEVSAIEGSADARPRSERVTDRSIGRRLSIVRGEGPRVGKKNARVRRYLIEIDRRLRTDRDRYADQVERILSDRRSWIGGRGVALKRMSRGPVAFRVTLAAPSLTDRLCAPLPTNRIYSCYMRGRSVLNAWRWRRGAAAYHRDIDGYRTYLVNHEVGHALGHGHGTCPARGRKAPVMMQQTKGVRPCVRNPWPLERERR